MPNLNRVMLIGRLGADPESRALPSGGSVCNLRLATSEKWKDKQSGEEKERTEWHTIVAFNRLAEICAEYLRKGHAVYFEGQLRTEKWTDKQGAERYSTKIYAQSMQMLEGKRGGGESATREPIPPKSRSTETDGAQHKPEEFDDDIPF